MNYLELKFFTKEPAQRKYDVWNAKGYANVELREVEEGWIVSCDLPATKN